MDLKRRLYDVLEKQGFWYSEEPRTPGSLSCMTNWHLEVTAVEQKSGLRVDFTTFHGKPDGVYVWYRCMDKQFLEAHALLNSPRDLEHALDLVERAERIHRSALSDVSYL